MFPECTILRQARSKPKYNNHIVSVFVSSLFLAGAAAAAVGGWTSNSLGRRATMMMGGACFAVGTVLVSCAYHISMLVIGRLILGFGVGFATQATPLYLSEMSPFKLRGALNILFQLAITIGILAAQLINYGTQSFTAGWRVSLALGGVPSVFFLVGSFLLPDTPNSLVARGYAEEARAVLQRIRGAPCNVSAEFEDIVDGVEAMKHIQNPYLTILHRHYWPQLIMCVAIPMSQQLTGINAIIFFSPQLFEGTGNESALLSTVIVGAVNVGSTLVALLLVEKLGRRFLFIAGGLQFNFEADSSSTAMATAIVAFICLFVAGFAWSWGPLGWLVPSEISPMEIRAACTGINTFTNFLFTFLIGQTFLSMLCSLEWGVFLLFSGFVVLMTLFIIACVPETKGVPVEEVDVLVVKKHWLWSKVVAGAPRVEDYSLDRMPSLDPPKLSPSKLFRLEFEPSSSSSASGNVTTAVCT
eukprot:gene24848-10505_t